MVNVCHLCNNCKFDREREEEYCEVLRKQGKNIAISGRARYYGDDPSEECKSFAWNCDMEKIVRELKWLSDRYDELSSAKHELVIMRKGKISDELRPILDQLRAMKQSKE